MNAAARNGDPRAGFDDLVVEHERAVLSICRAILRDEHLGADAAQDAFVRLWRRLESDAAAPREVGPWLRRVAVSTALDHARRRGVRAEADERRAADEPAAAAASREPAPERSAARAELAARLEHAVARLPEGQRAIFRLRHFGGLPLAEVAAALGVALPTVKTQFARACLKLHDALRHHREDLDEDLR